MAAGAYKGLTIRIGAETTKLTTALRGANSAIYKTQSELNRLNKALKLDPGNQNAAQLQFGALSSQATNLAREIDVLKKGIGEMGTTAAKSVEGVSIAELANDTRSATLANEDALATYNKLNGELEKTYSNLTRIAHDNDLDFTFGNAEGEINSFHEIENALYEMAAAGAITNDELSEMTYEVDNLKGQWMGARDALDDYSNVAKLEEMNVKLAEAESKLKQVAEQFASMAMKSDLAKSLQPMKDKVDQLSDATNRAKDRFSRLNEAAKLNPTSIMTAAHRARELSEATEAAREKSRALKEIIDKYKADGIAKISKEVGNAAIAYEKAKSHVADLKAELEKTVAEEGEASEKARELEAALSDAITHAKKVGKVDEYRELVTQLDEAKAASKGMKAALVGDLQSVGTAAVNAAIEIGNLMKQVGGAVIDASTEVDAAYRDMRKTVEGTEAQYKDLYDAAMKYSQTHVTSADTMLEMEALAGQVGIAADQLQNFAEVAANLDVATDIDAETIALQLGQITNVMTDLKPENVQGFADALVDLGNKMPAQESAIMQISQRLSSVGDVAGFSTPEILGWAAAIASTGQRSEAAATGISNTITSIQSAVSNGGDDLEAFAKVVDMTADEFKDAWGKDASGVLRKFIGELGDLGPDAIKQLEDLGIEGIRQTQTLLGLSKTVENVDKALGISQGAWDRYAQGIPIDGIGEAAQEASRKAEGFSGSMAKMQNSAQVLAASLGEYLAPYIDKAAELLQKLTDFVNNASDSTKDAAMAFGVLTGGIATVYPILSTVGGVFKRFFGSVGKLAVRSLGNMVNLFGNAKAAISLFASDGVGALPVIFPKATAAIAAFSGKITALLTALGTVVGATTMVVGSIAALAIAVGVDYAVKQAKARKEAKLFNDAIGGVKGVTEGLHADLMVGADDLDTYADKWSGARIDYEKFMESTAQHASTMMDTRTEMGDTVGALEKYYDIINKAIGAGDDYTGSMGELQWALDGLAQITGETYDAEDILAGKLDDETINADKLRESIYNLIEAKKQQSKLDAITNMRTEAYQGQMEAEKVMEEAWDKYNDKLEYAKKNYGDLIEQYGGWDKFIESDYSGAEQLRQLESDAKKAQEVYEGWGDTIRDLDNEYDALYDDAARINTSAYGDREGIIMTTDAMYSAIEANGRWGKSVEEIQGNVKKFSQDMQDAGIGVKEFTELSRENPDLFGEMVKRADGDMGRLLDMVEKWNNKHLEEKYGEIKWNDDHTAFETLEGEIYEWNGNDYVLKVGTEVDDSAVDEAKANAEEGAEMPVDAEVDDSDVDDAKANAEEGTTMPVNAQVDDSGIDDAKGEAEAGTTMNVNLVLDSSTFGGDLANATSNAGGAGITIPVNLDTGAVAEQLSAIGGDKEINIAVSADTSTIGYVNDSLASIPSDIRSMVTVTESGTQTATSNIKSLNDVAAKMKDVKAKYEATGNAATKSDPATKINNIVNAGSRLSNKTGTYTALGNAATTDGPANRIKSLADAIARLPTSKTVTVTYNLQKNGSAPSGQAASASGAYIPYNKIPRHAAGIFTRPTLTNIGWVGEDGAELYSGNSLVPLTNRKYSMPYIDDISDAVARKLGNAAGTTYNTYINDAIVNSDEEIQAAVVALLSMLQRKGAMNRG